MEYKVLLYFGYIWLTFCLIVVIILLYRIITIRKFIEVRILPDSILVDNKEIQAKKIENIYVKGYFIPVIGIKPVDHKFPPIDYVLVFLTKNTKV